MVTKSTRKATTPPRGVKKAVQKRPAQGAKDEGRASPKQKPSAAAAAAGEPTFWFNAFAGALSPPYERYMLQEWGFEMRGDRRLFEMVCLEGQQAGLSWATVLAKRDAYRKAFHGFRIKECAALTPADVTQICAEAKAGPGGSQSVIRHIGKLQSIPHNARCVQELSSSPYEDPETGAVHKTLDSLLWSFVGGQPILNNWPDMKSIPAVTPAAQSMSKVLKKRGFKFVGPTICYALMQACGLVVDHPAGTPEHQAAKLRLAQRRPALPALPALKRPSGPRRG